MKRDPDRRAIRIGIPLCLDAHGRWRAGRTYHYIHAAYAEAVTRAGAIAVYLPPRDDASALIDAVDGLLVPGGDDLPPRDPYPPGVELDLVPEAQLAFDRLLLEAALTRALPVLGICYGMQLLAKLQGGQLHYHLPTDVPDAAEHRLQDPDGRHPLRVEPGSALAHILGVDPEPVNSLHHQAVADPGPEFRVSARADDGVIEAIEGSGDAFCMGVQWHPEQIDGLESRKLFEAFVAACSRNLERRLKP